ncbi:MAG: hypothetical protein WC496_01280 [Phycisphaerae bacterium]|jgi:hypothetical protein
MSKSNIIDFYEPQNDSLAVGAVSAKVYLDGQLCDYLVAEKVTLAADEFGQAVLSYYPKDKSVLPEETDCLVRCGQRIIIKTGYDGGIGEYRPQEWQIFAGLVERIDTEISGNQQKTTVIAKDSSVCSKPQLCREVELNCQWPGERISVSRTNIAEITGVKNCSPMHEKQFQIKTLTLLPGFCIGDRITASPDSRDILGVKYDNRSICSIEKIQMDFVNQQIILTAVKKRK